MLTVLNKLSVKELKKFGEFVCSPFFNKNKKAVDMFYYLEKGFPFIDLEYISKENISLHVYSEKIVNDVKVRKLISQFYKLIKKFLLYESLGKNAAANENIIIKNLEGTEFENEMPGMFSGLQDRFRISKLKNKHYYNNRIDFEREYYLNKVKTDLNVDKNLIRSCYRNVNYQYYYQKLECFYDSLTLNTELNVDPDADIDIDLILDIIRKRKSFFRKYHPEIYFKYLGVMLKITMDERYEQELLRCFKKNIMKYDEDFSFSYYSFLENFYYKKTNERGDYYKRKLIGIFDDIYIKGLYVKSNSRRIPRMLGRNYFRVVQMAYSLKDYEWAEKFIEKSKSALYPVKAEDIYKLSLARLHFEKKDYDKSLLYLNKVVYKDNYCHIISKFLLTRIYFEQENYKVIEHEIRNVKNFFYRKKNLSPFEKAHLQKFIYYIPRLLKVFKSDSDDKHYLAYSLRKKLDSDKDHIAFKNWYYEKLGQFAVDN